jgi:hypothetical protein
VVGEYDFITGFTGNTGVGVIFAVGVGVGVTVDVALTVGLTVALVVTFAVGVGVGVEVTVVVVGIGVDVEVTVVVVGIGVGVEVTLAAATGIAIASTSLKSVSNMYPAAVYTKLKSSNTEMILLISLLCTIFSEPHFYYLHSQPHDLFLVGLVL